MFFYTDTVCGVCDKYQVWTWNYMRKRPVVVLASKKPVLKSQRNLTITFKYTSTQTGGGEAVWPIPYTSAKLQKYMRGTRRFFLQKYGRYTGKQSNIQILKNGKNCFFNNAKKVQNTFLTL